MLNSLTDQSHGSMEHLDQLNGFNCTPKYAKSFSQNYTHSFQFSLSLVPLSMLNCFGVHIQVFSLILKVTILWSNSIINSFFRGFELGSDSESLDNNARDPPTSSEHEKVILVQIKICKQVNYAQCCFYKNECNMNASLFPCTCMKVTFFVPASPARVKQSYCIYVLFTVISALYLWFLQSTTYFCYRYYVVIMSCIVNFSTQFPISNLNSFKSLHTIDMFTPLKSFVQHPSTG